MQKAQLRIYLPLSLFIVLLCRTNVLAEEIHLKSGHTVEGKIIERTDKYIKIDFKGVTLTYFLDEIEKIEDATTKTATSAASETSTESKGELYMNEDVGFEIRGPKGWLMRKDIGSRSAKVVFTKNSTGFPMLGITIDVTPPTIKSAMDFVNLVLPEYRASSQREQAAFELVEAPHEIEVKGIKGSRFIFGMSGTGGKGMKSLDCKFMRNNIAVSIQGMDYPQTFDAHLKDFEAAVNSFRFLVPEEEFVELKKLAVGQLQFKPVDSQEYELLKNTILENMESQGSFKSLFILKDKTEPKLAQNNFIGLEWLMTYISPQNFEITQSDYYSHVADIWRVVDEDIYIKIGVWMPSPTQTDNPKINEMIKNRKEIYKMLSFRKYVELLKKEAPVGMAGYDQNKYTVINFKLPTADDLFTGKLKEGELTTDIFIWFSLEDKTIKFVKTNIEGRDKDKKGIRQEYEHYFSNYNASFKLGKPEMVWMGENK